jgi:hypothetical protein
MGQKYAGKHREGKSRSRFEKIFVLEQKSKTSKNQVE